MPIKVRVVWREAKGAYYFRWNGPNGRPCEEVIKDDDGDLVTKEKDAWQLVPAQQEKLKRRLSGDGSILWEEWAEIVKTDYIAGMSMNSQKSFRGILRAVARTIKPTTLADITTQSLTTHATKYRREGKSENTIASHFATMHAILNWSREQGHISELPRFPRLPRATGSKSRGSPLTDAQFDAMLAAVPKVVPESAVESWRHFLRGLWLSGLRLSEGINITWEPGPSGIWIDLSNPQRPKLAIWSKAEKGKRNRLLPITKDFREFILNECPDRTGNVFKPLVRYDRQTSSRDQCTHVICAIGKASGVVTEFGNHATAHDLRRSFGLRWALKNTPAPLLQQLMRHASIQTTLEYYARTDADRWEEELDRISDQHDLKVNGAVNRKKKREPKNDD